MSSIPQITTRPLGAAELCRTAVGRALSLGRQLTSDSLLQKSVLSVFDQAVVSGTSFAASIIIGRACGRTELGLYSLVLSLILFARGIQEQLVCAPYMIYCGRRKGEAADTYAGSSLVHQILLLALASLCLACMSVTGLGPDLVQPLMWLLLMTAPLILLRDYVRQMSFAQLELPTAIAMDLFIAAVQIGGFLALACFGMLEVRTALIVMAAGCGLATIGWLVGKRRPMVVRISAAVADWRHNWPFAKWALASQLLACTTPFIMPWVVALTHGEAATGILAACSTLVGLSNMFMMGLANFLSPKAAHAFAEGGLPELKTILRKTGLLFVVTLGAASVAGFMVGDWIATLVYGPSFAGTGAIIGILATSILANSLGVTFGNGLWAMERPSASFRADVVSLVVTIVSTIVLIPTMGTLGAALAMLAGTSSDALVRYWALRQVMHEVEVGRAAA